MNHWENTGKPPMISVKDLTTSIDKQIESQGREVKVNQLVKY